MFLYFYEAIKENVSVNQKFYFSNTDVGDVLKEITALKNIKNGSFVNVSTKSLKGVSDDCSPPLYDVWYKEIIMQKSFPNKLKGTLMQI